MPDMSDCDKHRASALGSKPTCGGAARASMRPTRYRRCGNDGSQPFRDIGAWGSIERSANTRGGLAASAKALSQNRNSGRSSPHAAVRTTQIMRFANSTHATSDASNGQLR